MSKLEEVARAMMPDAWEDVTDVVCLCSGEELHYKRYNSLLRASDRIRSLQYANAAVEALREPTEKMIWAADDKVNAGVASQWEQISNNDLQEGYIAMITAILSEPQTSSKPLPSLEGQGPEMTQDQIDAMERGGK